MKPRSPGPPGPAPLRGAAGRLERGRSKGGMESEVIPLQPLAPPDGPAVDRGRFLPVGTGATWMSLGAL